MNGKQNKKFGNKGKFNKGNRGNDKFQKMGEVREESRRASRDNRNVSNPRGIGNASVFADAVNHGSNDPAWYVVSEDMARDVASIPLGYPAGAALTDLPTLTNPEGIRFPGIMVLPYHPIIGDAPRDKSSSINVSAQSLYSYIVHINSGSRNYEYPDLFMYVYAMANMYTILAEARRAYGVTQMYTRENRYYGKALLTSLGWDADDVLANMSKFRYIINNLAIRLSAFAVPKGFDFSTRQIWMSTKLWVDSEGEKSQMYAYKLNKYLTWESKAYNGGTVLQYREMSDFATGEGLYTVDSFNTQFNSVLDKLWQDTDISIMTRDIIHSYRPEELVVLDQLQEDYRTVPEYDVHVRDQIQNLITVGGGDVTDMCSLADDGNSIISTHPRIWQYEGVIHSNIGYAIDDTIGASRGFATGKFINFAHDGAGPKEVLVATRLMPIVKHVASIGNLDWVCYKALGSEVVENIEIYTLSSDPTKYVDKLVCATEVVYSSQTIGLDFETYLRKIAAMEKFMFHPKVYIYRDSASNTGFISDGLNHITGDVSCYAQLPDSAHELMSNMAILKEFTPTNVGQYNPVNRA